MNPENQPFIISHAQNREDIILSGFFPGLKDGFYVDIGANDPSADSVTKNFYERGWHGINVEPIKRLHNKLVEARPRDINLNIGISNKAGSLTFREYKEYHGLSSFAHSIHDEYDKLATENKKFKDYVEHTVKIKTLPQIFEENNVQTINFMKVDVEGYEYEVLSGNDWKRYRPQVLCIESNHIAEDWRPILHDNDYELVFFDGLNDYYVDKNLPEVKNSFSYIHTMLPTPIIDYRAMGIIEYYKKAKYEADSASVALNNELHAAKHALFVAQEELRQLTRLRGLVKALVRKINRMIEELILPTNAQKEPASGITSNLGTTVYPSDNPSKILEAIKSYDKINLTKLNPPKHHVRYMILRIYRKVIIRGLKKVAKSALKIAKRTIHLVRG